LDDVSVDLLSARLEKCREYQLFFHILLLAKIGVFFPPNVICFALKMLEKIKLY